VRVNLDSGKGFDEARELIGDRKLENQFQSFASHRRTQAAELKGYVRWEDSDWEARGTFSAALHRTWMKIRESLSGKDLVAVLSEVERGEDQIKAKYEEALKSEPGTELEPVLRRHYEAVKQVHDSMRDLRDAMKKKKQ
jgi:uncharacterized protein (TIGR02284 family)